MGRDQTGCAAQADGRENYMLFTSALALLAVSQHLANALFSQTCESIVTNSIVALAISFPSFRSVSVQCLHGNRNRNRSLSDLI